MPRGYKTDGSFAGKRFQKGHKKGMTGKKHSETTKKKMSEARKGKYKKHKNPNWKGGEFIGNGYIYILKPNHPFCTKRGYIKRTNLIMEKYLGRYLTKEEVIHHKGIKYPLGSIENRQDDRIENLKLFKDKSEHMKFHHPKGTSFLKK